MPTLPSVSKSAWLLPIVFGICAIMLLPGGAVLGAGHAASSGSPVSAYIPPSVPAVATGAPLGPSAHSIGAALSASTIASLEASAPASSKALVKQALSNAGRPVYLLPNLKLLEHPVSSPSQVITPFYLGPPAPMGVSDIGLGSTPYAYNTTHFFGSVTFNTVPNATNPGGEGVVLPDAGAFGYQGSPSQFGIQLNTVLTNVSLPGDTNGIFWVQNVLEVNATDVSFDVSLSNFTSSAFVIEPGSILSWTCPHVPLATQVPSSYVQCTNPVPAIPISPVDYPLTLGIYTNASLNAQNDTVLSYGYSFSGAHGFRATGTEIEYVFNNLIPLSTPLPYLPGFEVNGKTPNPVELDDAEIDLVGIIGGANAAFNTLNATMQLLHSNLTSGGWQSSPSAYNFGVDTGETSSSVATTWAAQGAATAYAGPSMLEGLWGSEPQVAVPSTSIEFSGSISPNYGFVFVSNVNPATGEMANFSWVPTTASGTFQTWLPTGTYYVRALADGFDQYNGTSFSASTTSYSIVMTSHSLSLDQSLQAPIYINGDAQAAALATVIDGSATPPYDFVNLPLGVNLTFNHVNEFGFPEFVMFQAMDLSTQIQVSNVYETAADYDYFSNSIATGLIYPQEPIIDVGFNFTQQVTVYYSSNAYVYNTTFPTVGFDNEVFLWGDTGAVTDHISAMDFATAVEVGFSTGTLIENTNATDLGYGIEDISTHGTTVWNDSVYDSYDAFEAYGSSGGTYSYINVTDSDGIFVGYTEAGLSYFSIDGVTHASFNWFRASEAYPGNLSVSNWVTWTNTVITNDSAYLNVYTDWGTTFNALTVEDGATGPWLYNTTYTNITGYTVYNTGVGSDNQFTNNTQVTNLLVSDSDVGILTGNNGGMTTSSFTDVVQDNSVAAISAVQDLVGATVSDLTVLDGGVGIGAAHFTDVTVSDVWAYSGEGAELDDGAGVTLSGIHADLGGLGAGLESNTAVSGTGISANDLSIGLESLDSSYVSANDITASNESIGVEIENSGWTTVSSGTATNMSAAVFSYESAYTSVSGITASNKTLSSPYSDGAVLGMPGVAAVVTEFDQIDSISNVHVTTYPAAYYDYDSYDPGVNDVNATASTYAIVLEETYYGVFTNVGAFQDVTGADLYDDAEYNVITQSAFVDSTSYGVAIYDGYDNLVYDNTFIANNGATNVYSAAHIQAYAGYGGYNEFNLGTLGNYWADWHTYLPSGSLAPYPIGDDNFDYYPIGGPEGTVAVYFTETGLLSGTAWSVTLNGATESTTNSQLVFYILPGSYSFTSGSVTGFTVSPGSGTVTASGASVNEDVTYTAVPTTVTVTLTESGLASGTSWSATVDGVTETGSTATLTFTVAPGTYAYQVTPVAGYVASPSSGMLTPSSGTYAILVTFSQMTYPVTITEEGLATGVAWTVTLNGVSQTTVGNSVTVYLPDGTYTYTVTAVSGYTLTGGSGSVTVNGAPAGASAAFTPTSTPSLVTSSTYNTGFEVTIIVAVIALVVALLALLLRPRKPTENPPAPWMETGPGSAGSGTGGTTPSGGTGSSKGGTGRS